MENGHVEIHDPFSNQNGLTGTTDPEHQTSSDTSSMEETPEYRLLMAYATRRRTEKRAETSDTLHSPVALNRGEGANGTTAPQTPTQTETEEMLEKKKGKKKKKKKGLKRVLSIFKCVRPEPNEDKQQEEENFNRIRTQSSDDQSEVNFRVYIPESVTVRHEDELDEVANRLAKLADEIKLEPSELDTDSEEDDVERLIGLLLREHGDRFDQKLKEANIGSELFSDYGFFRKVMNNLLTTTGYRSADPNSLGPQASQKTQIAVTCEITSRLSAVDTLPMSRLLQHGARYLQDYYSDWARSQGGYEKAIESDEEEVE